MKTQVDRKALALEIYDETGIHISPDDPLMEYIIGCDAVMNAHEKRWNEIIKTSAKQLSDHASFVVWIQSGGIVICAVLLGLAIAIAF